MAAGAGSAATNGRTPVLIADHDEESRALARAALHEAGYETLEAANGKEALDAARRAFPRLAVLEVMLPGLSGYEVCHQLRQEFGDELPIVFLSGDRTEPLDRVAGLLIGADDYLAKPFVPDELLARVRRLVRRTTPLAPRVASLLTTRELEVLRLLAQGLEQEAIAGKLFISRRTVGTHIENIMRKLGVRNRAQAVAVAYRDNVVDGL
jgi:DNA-binding NarL/FixJ family response regulator